ncbi:MAG TPA: hypothetical protein VJ891_03845 [Casimicrobiaceae bacterium]|nr:hypothetical protein [Casimicrobiaceae bacterium]
MRRTIGSIAIAVLSAALVVLPARAQIDPVRRDLVEFGYDQPLQGHAPIGAYVFYYLSRPQFGDADHALRVAVSPVYLDGEWDVRDALGKDTDIGIGISGGGLADDYNEISEGRWLRDQSFSGQDGGIDLSLYHLFNPGQRLPVNAILNGGFRYVAFERTGRNPPSFAVPSNQPIAHVRAGIRAGGIEPVLAPALAAELSVWYDAQVRFDPGTYGFAGDRDVQKAVQKFFARALFDYTLPDLHHKFSLSVLGGASVHPDRLSAFRIGGVLPLEAEFPLLLPGYYEGEFSARNFVLFGGAYAIPLDPGEHWQLGFGAASARIDYTPGLAQPHAWNTGASASLGYVPSTKAWKAYLLYGHGFDAIRHDRRGADSVSLLMEFDLERLGFLRSDATSAK